MPSSPRPRRAFTLVEMLTVVGIIALLLAILLAALGGVIGSGRKTKELNALRQVGIGWKQYASFNDDGALPGYLSTRTQQIWRVRYEYPGGEKIEPPQVQGDTDSITGPWPWRLLPYLDFNHELVHGYREDADPSTLRMVQQAEEVATEPWFAYNGYYIGGWWEADEDGRLAFTRFVGEGVVARSPSRIERSSEFVLFCTAVDRQPGLLKPIDDVEAGTHVVVPPFVGQDEIWRSPLDDSVIEVVQGSSDALEVGIPAARYGQAVSTLYADLHVGTQLPGTLDDMRQWIYSADAADFRHGAP